MNKVYKLPIGDLASRHSAISLRQEIEIDLLDNKHLIYIDLNGVISISESYADELFGVLVIKYGIETVLNKLKIINVIDNVLNTIVNVIDRRDMATK